MAKSESKDAPEAQEGEAPEMPEGTRSGFDIEEGSANAANFPDPEHDEEDLALPDTPDEGGEGEGEGEGEGTDEGEGEGQPAPE